MFFYIVIAKKTAFVKHGIPFSPSYTQPFTPKKGHN